MTHQPDFFIPNRPSNAEDGSEDSDDGQQFRQGPARKGDHQNQQKSSNLDSTERTNGGQSLWNYHLGLFFLFVMFQKQLGISFHPNGFFFVHGGQSLWNYHRMTGWWGWATPLKTIRLRQLGWLGTQLNGKITNVPNQQPDALVMFHSLGGFISSQWMN